MDILVIVGYIAVFGLLIYFMMIRPEKKRKKAEQKLREGTQIGDEILTIGGILNIGFDKVYLMQNNLNLRQSEIIATYVYKVGMSAGDGQFSYATAIGLFNSVINCLLLIIVNAISRRIEGGATLW